MEILASLAPQYLSTDVAAREGEHNRGPVSSPHVPSSEGQWQAYQQARLYWQSTQKTHSLKQRWEEHPKRASAQLQPGFHRACLGVCQHCHRGLEKNSYIEVSSHILQQTTLIGEKASKDLLFSGFPPTVSTMQRNYFWCIILQVILLQCFGSWDKGGNIFWLILTISLNTLLSSNMWNELKVCSTEIFAKLFLTFCSTIYTKLKLFWMAMVILTNSETKVNQNNTVNILKLNLICP